jgi:hypothetical protein
MSFKEWIVNVLAMQTQGQVPPSGGGFKTMPICWTAGDVANSSSDEREVLGRSLEALLAELDRGTIPSGRNGNAEAAGDLLIVLNLINSPREPSAQ